jgi:ribonucleoside-diphosphate reductase alpha chain
LNLQETSQEIWEQKYQLKDKFGNAVDKTIDDTYERVAKALASVEEDSAHWYDEFLYALKSGATPAGRILSNVGALEHKPSTSTINCTVSGAIHDSMEGIMHAATEAAITLKAGCGIGYEFSTLRPKGAFVSGAGAYTSGPLSFMDIFDATCFTVSSAGGRRGAQMGTFAVWHPDVEDFIKAKREDGRLRQFNLSLLIDNEFMEAVKSDGDYNLVFPVSQKEKDTLQKQGAEFTQKELFWEPKYCNQQGYEVSDGMILCKIYKTVKARYLWDIIMKSTYDFAEPGFLLIDEINRMNNNSFCETIRATNPCGEQPLPPYGSCLLGSVNLAKFIDKPFTSEARFLWNEYKDVVRIFSRMLDNVVELNGLALDRQRHEIETKRRHGMGFLGLGSALSMMGITYGSGQSLEFAENVMKHMAIEGYRAGAEIAKEKGCAPILEDNANFAAWFNGPYIQRLIKEDPTLGDALALHKCRYTHATSIAPTGTISLSVNNNVSNGIEPTFAHHYTRNVIKEGKKSKESVDVYSYEMLAYKELTGETEIPASFSTTDTVTPKQHVDIQAVVQLWCDSSISKTINVPTELDFEEFKDIYLYAYDKGLKGCTTFRFNPEAFQGVLVKEDDLEATTYEFTLEDGSVHQLKGNDKINYEGETHSAANLYDALKEGYYGKF